MFRSWLNFSFTFSSPPHLLSSPLSSGLSPHLIPSIPLPSASPLQFHLLFLLPKRTSPETEPLPRQLKTGQVLFRDVEINDCSPTESRGDRRGGGRRVVGKCLKDGERVRVEFGEGCFYSTALPATRPTPLFPPPISHVTTAASWNNT